MSIECSAVYGFEVDVDDERVEEIAGKLGLDTIYGGDPIPGFDEMAIGVSLYIGNDTEEALFKKIQKAKKDLSPVLNELKKELDIHEKPRIIILACGSW